MSGRENASATGGSHGEETATVSDWGHAAILEPRVAGLVSENESAADASAGYGPYASALASGNATVPPLPMSCETNLSLFGAS